MTTLSLHSYRSSRPGSMRRAKPFSTSYVGDDHLPVAVGTRSYSDSYYPIAPTGRHSSDSGHAEAVFSQQLPVFNNDGREWYDCTASCTLSSQPVSADDHTYEQLPSQVPLTVTQSSGYSSPEVSSLTTISEGQRHSSQHHQTVTKPRRSSEPAALGHRVTLNVNVHVSSCSSGSNGESTLTLNTQPAVSQYTIECSPEAGPYSSRADAPASTVYQQSEVTATASAERHQSYLGDDLLDAGLVPAASPLQEEVLDYLMPQLMQYMNPQALLPYLQRHKLVSEEDVDYICNPLRTDLDRRQRVVTKAPYRDPDAFDRFVQCLEEEPQHTGHKYLTRRLREAIQKKRQSPFKRLSSIRMTSPPSLSSSRWQFSPRISPLEHQGPQPPTHYHSASLDRSLTKKRREFAKKPAPPIEVKLRRHQSESTADRWPTFPRTNRRGVSEIPQKKREPSSPGRLSLPRSFSQSESLGASKQQPQLPQRVQNIYATPMYSTAKDEYLTKKKLQWLQDRVHMKDCPEPVIFTSKTHYGQERQLLYSGTLAHHGKTRFVVLFNDMLLVLKGRKRSHSQGKLSGVFSPTQSSQLDWFADQTFTTKEPYLLHLLAVQKQSRKTYVCLNYKHHSEVKEICLQACSEEAKKVWEEQLLDAIKLCTATHAETVLHVGTRIPLSKRQSASPYTKLAVKMLWIEFTEEYRSLPLYCTIQVCGKKCRTNYINAETTSNWSFACEFTDLAEMDTLTLFFGLYKENVFQPDECLGSAGMQLSPGRETRQVMRGQVQLEDSSGATVARIAIHNELGWETQM